VEAVAMNDPDKNVIKVDPGTLLFVITAVLLLPLLLTGFFAH